MRRPLRLRRYLVHFSSYNIPQIFTGLTGELYRPPGPATEKNND